MNWKEGLLVRPTSQLRAEPDVGEGVRGVNLKTLEDRITGFFLLHLM